MKKSELMNGDIVVMLGGSVAVVIGEGNDAYLLFQYGGFEFLDEYYNDDLYNEVDDDMVMQVFRSNGEMNLEIYSRCIVCRMTIDGEFESLGDSDFEIWGRYLAN